MGSCQPLVLVCYTQTEHRRGEGGHCTEVAAAGHSGLCTVCGPFYSPLLDRVALPLKNCHDEKEREGDGPTEQKGVVYRVTRASCTTPPATPRLTLTTMLV